MVVVGNGYFSSAAVVMKDLALAAEAADRSLATFQAVWH